MLGSAGCVVYIDVHVDGLCCRWLQCIVVILSMAVLPVWNNNSGVHEECVMLWVAAM